MTQQADQSRPDFEPPMRPAPVSAVADEAPPKRGVGLSRFAGRAIVVVVLVVVAVCVYLANRSPEDSILDRSSGPAAAVPKPWSLPPSMSPALPPSLRHPLPPAGLPRPADPLLRQVWETADEVYPMDLAGFTFAFRTPETWGCVVSSQAAVRWVCLDETSRVTRGKSAEPSGGIFESDECKAPCAATDYADVNARLTALGIDTSGLHVVDSRTRVDDRIDPSNPTMREYRMSRIYDSNGDGRLDRHLWVRIDVNATDQVAVQKIFGDLYDATR